MVLLRFHRLYKARVKRAGVAVVTKTLANILIKSPAPTNYYSTSMERSPTETEVFNCTYIEIYRRKVVRGR
jgi:hypothetical protein